LSGWSICDSQAANIFYGKKYNGRLYEMNLNFPQIKGWPKPEEARAERHIKEGA
jgi:hypothetical protein